MPAAAIEILISRVAEVKNITNKSLQDEEYTIDLVIDLLECALHCKGVIPRLFRI